jgi:metallophosphoesterase (TIGR00282 family)
VKVAFIGDVVGKTGRQAVADLFPKFKQEQAIDLAVANVENAAGGFGVTAEALDELEKAGIDLFTSGNHIWDNRAGVPLLDEKSNLIRPANYPFGVPGRGHLVREFAGQPVAVVNIQGRVFMPAIDCPFRTMDEVLRLIDAKARIIIVDIHAEATSEKIAMSWHLDGRVSLVIGTHTHVPTKDCRILPKGTGAVTDVGMAGSFNSVIGMDKQAVLDRFIQMRPFRFQVAKGDVRLDLVLAELDPETGKPTHLEHLELKKEN